MPASNKSSGSGPLVGRIALVYCLIFAAFAGVCRAQTNITDFILGTSTFNFPEGITYGPDGAYWFCEYWGGKIGRIETTGTNAFTQFFVTNSSQQPFPYGIVTGPDGNLWFTEATANKIGRMSTNGTYIEFTLPHTNSRPATIIVGPDGNLWFSEYNLSRIAVFNPSANTAAGPLTLVNEFGPFGTNAQFGAPGLNAQIYGLTSGPDGKIWFAQEDFGFIGNITLDGSVTNLYPLPGSNAQPFSIVAGSDGAMWFSEFHSNKIGRITISGKITEYPLPLRVGFSAPHPCGMVANPNDGSIYFTEFNGDAVGRITTNGIITLFPTRASSSFPTLMATGGDNNIWWGENIGGTPGVAPQRISRLTVAEALDLHAPLATNFTSGTTVSGLLATFFNSNHTNTVTIDWGDGTGSALVITNVAANAQVTTNTVLTTNNIGRVTNSLTITNVVPINTNNGTYDILASHTYSALSSYIIQLNVRDGSNDVSFLNISVLPSQFFAGQVQVNSQVEFLQFPNGNDFGFYTLQSFPYVFHFDMGWEYWIDANDGQGGVDMYDFASGHYFYSNPELFPILFDFSLNAWLYYFPDTTRSGHYTTNPREFYNFSTATVFSQ